jgi:hypothetical protein
MNKLYAALEFEMLLATTNDQSRNSRNYQELTLGSSIISRIISLSNHLIKAEGCFNRDIKKNASENSIILSLVEYSRLRERIWHGA